MHDEKTPARWLNAFRHANTGNLSEFEALLQDAPAAAANEGAAAPRADSPSRRSARTVPAGNETLRATTRPIAVRSTSYPRLDRSMLADDLLAGTTVSLVAIPQSLAYAQLAGVPAYFGLYAALVPTIVGAVFGSSRLLSTGPVAMTSLLTAASVAPLATIGTDTYCGYVILLALLSGLLQVAFGLLRVGVLLNFLSHPVLIGFINAAALIIGMSQLPTLLGMSARQSDHFLVDIWHVLVGIDAMHGLSLAFGAATLGLLVLLKRVGPRLPGVLIAVVALTWVSSSVDYAGMGGRVVGDVPGGFPRFALPDLDRATVVTLFPAAFVIAVISFMEAMSSAKIIAIRTRVPWDENRELVGQGLAKIAAALSQTMPVSGSFSRSALNLAANARTRLSSIVSACCVAATLLFFTRLLRDLPKPVLAAVIMMAVVGLINFRAIGKAWRANRDDGIAAVATFVATLAFAPHIENGIVTGVMLSLSLLLYRLMRPRVTVLDIDAAGCLRDAAHPTALPPHTRIGAVRFDGDLRFVNASYFEDAVLELEQSRPRLEFVLVQSGGIHHLDASGAEMLANLVHRLASSGVTLAFSGITDSVRAVMERIGLLESIGSENLFRSDDVAVDALLQRLSARA